LSTKLSTPFVAAVDASNELEATGWRVRRFRSHLAFNLQRIREIRVHPRLKIQFRLQRRELEGLKARLESRGYKQSACRV
jgi:hypothetical protein